MKNIKLIVGLLAILSAALAIALLILLINENALITHPKGIIAKRELDVIITIILLMLTVTGPTFIFLFITLWKQHGKHAETKDNPNYSGGVFRELILWLIPSVVIAVMIVVNWTVTHELDPYLPIKSEAKPLKIQVVALDWKWLFIYPEQGIATLNFVQFPERTPIHFILAADGSPMNSFWLPQMGGQIYAMTGMATQIHMMADGPGEYTGRAAEINGQGYAYMTFVAKSTSQSDFDQWVTNVKQSPLTLTDHLYHELVNPSRDLPVTLYSYVEKDLFNKILMKYLHPNAVTLWKTTSLQENSL